MSQERINKLPADANLNFAPAYDAAFNPNAVLGAFFHPVGTDFLTAAQLEDIKTNIQNLLTADLYKDRAFFVQQFEPDSEDNGEGRARQTRSQHKYTTAKGTYDRIFTLVGPYADYVTLKKWAKGKGKRYLYIPVDENGAMRHRKSPAGAIYGAETVEIEVLPIGEADTSTIVTYQFRVSLRNRDHIDEAKHTHITDENFMSFDIFDRTYGLRGVEQWYINETTFGSPGNGIHYISVEGSNGEENLVELFQAVGELRQASAWTVTLASGAAVAITSVALITVNNVVRYLAFTLDQDDYTNGDKAYLRSTLVNTLSPFIGNRFAETNTIQLTLAK